MKFLRDLLEKKSILIKLMLSCIGTALVAILIVALIFVQLIKSDISTGLNEETRLALSSISALMQNTFDAASKAAYVIDKNYNVRKLLFPGEGDDYNVVDVAQFVRSICISNPNIFSVYLCNNSAIVYKSLNDDDFAEDFQALETLARDNSVLIPIPRVIQSGKGESKDVYTVIYQENDAAMVVLNLSVSDLYAQIYKEPAAKQVIFAADAGGTVLIHNDPANFKKSVASEDYFKTAASSGAANGYFNVNMNGKTYICSYVKTGGGKYVVFSLTDPNAFFSKVTKAQNRALLTCLIIIFVIMLLAVFLYYRLFTPINAIFTNIRSVFGGGEKPGRQLNDAAYVSNVLGNMVKRLNTLETDSANGLNALRDNYMKKLLVSCHGKSNEEILESLKKFSYIRSDGSYCVVAMRLCGYEAFLRNNTRGAIEFQLNSISHITCDALESIFGCSAVNIDGDSEYVAFIVDFCGAEDEKNYKRLVDALETIQGNILGLLSLELTIGLSDPFGRIEQLPLMYRQARDMTDYRLVYGRRSILGRHNVPPGGAGDRKTPAVAGIMSCIRNNDRAGYTAAVGETLAALSGQRYDQIVNAFVKIALEIQRIPADMQPSLGDASLESTDDILKRMKGFEDGRELCAWFDEQFSRISGIIANIKNRKMPDFVRDVIAYIHENFGDKNLSANRMADRLSITPQYFSRVFNECTGVRFPDYINDIRLERAKSLLLADHRTSINEIYDAVGYSNRNYFTAAFTKKFGLSPARYRSVHTAGL